MTATAAELPQHSSKSNEHYTPVDIIAAARHTMGGIDLDPATTELVNRTRVWARDYYTQQTNGFNRPWSGKVFLNPPGGKVGNRSNAALWWNKLVEEYLTERDEPGRVTQAVFLGFTLEIMATSQDARCWAGDFPLCIPRHRLAFDVEAKPGEFASGQSPPHSNVIVYLPQDGMEGLHGIYRFKESFWPFGEVVIPQGWDE